MVVRLCQGLSLDADAERAATRPVLPTSANLDLPIADAVSAATPHARHQA